jgi:hypothetical protein
MGYNTTVVILNDALGFIEDDPNFGKNLVQGIRLVNRGKPVDIHARSYHAAAQVIESHHADSTSLVAVGGNDGILLGQYYYVGDASTEEGKVEILKEMAHRLGYRIVKKPAKV